MTLRWLVALLLAALIPLAQAEPALRVLTTFSILQDFTAQIGGERVAVSTLPELAGLRVELARLFATP